jgi:DNA-directed RNA polymerase III subunit RPC3
MFQSPTDTYNKIEKEVLDKFFGGSTKGIKQKEELQNKIKERLQALRLEREWKPKEMKGKKRTPNGDLTSGLNGSNKRRRLADGAVNIDHFYEDESTRLDVGFPSFSEQDTIEC